MNNTTEATHNESNSRFEYGRDESLALLEYRISGSEMAIHHTFVPNEFRGQGIAAVLTKAALDYADQNDLTVVPECSYVAAYISRRAQS